MEYLCHEERLKHLCLMLLDKRRDRNDLLETSKIINGYYDINVELGLFFEFDMVAEENIERNYLKEEIDLICV